MGGSTTQGQARNVAARAMRLLCLLTMPRPRQYPLDPLLAHRERKVDEATAELGDAVKQRELAEAERLRAERAKETAEARASAIRDEERSRLQGGELRAVDLARAQAWEVAVSAEMQTLGRAVETAAADVDAKRTDEAEARGALAQKKAEHGVVEKDKERFTLAKRRAAEAAEEENAEEAWRDRRASGGGEEQKGRRG